MFRKTSVFLAVAVLLAFLGGCPSGDEPYRELCELLLRKDGTYHFLGSVTGMTPDQVMQAAGLSENEIFRDDSSTVIRKNELVQVMGIAFMTIWNFDGEVMTEGLLAATFQDRRAYESALSVIAGFAAQCLPKPDYGSIENLLAAQWQEGWEPDAPQWKDYSRDTGYLQICAADPEKNRFFQESGQYRILIKYSSSVYSVLNPDPYIQPSLWATLAHPDGTYRFRGTKAGMTPEEILQLEKAERDNVDITLWLRFPKIYFSDIGIALSPFYYFDENDKLSQGSYVISPIMKEEYDTIETKINRYLEKNTFDLPAPTDFFYVPKFYPKKRIRRRENPAPDGSTLHLDSYGIMQISVNY